MIKVNGQEFTWEEGMVVRTVLQKKNFTHPAIIVTINGEWVAEERFDTAVIRDGDDVQVMHLIAGG